MISREDELTTLVLVIIGLILCGCAIGAFFSIGFGFLFVGLPPLGIGLYGLLKNQVTRKDSILWASTFMIPTRI